jgi:hypothetical protein
MEAARQFDKEREEVDLLLPQFRTYLQDGDRLHGLVPYKSPKVVLCLVQYSTYYVCATYLCMYST